MLMDSLDVNGTCKRPIKNLNGAILVYGEIMQTHTIHASNYTVTTST